MSASDFTGNSLGILSSDATLSAGQILFGGSITAGNTSSVTVSGHAPFTDTVVAGDTLYTIIARYVAAINAALGPSITASLANPVVPQLAISPHRDGNPVPTISASATGTLTVSIVSQPGPTTDANPVVYGGHIIAGQNPVAWDSVCLEQHVGANTTDNTKASIAYSWRYTRIMDPNLATLRGVVDVGTAAPLASSGYVLPVYSYSHGIYAYNPDGSPAAGTDMGYGTINMPVGYYVNGGKLGEYVESVLPSASAVSLTTGVAANVTTLSLASGDWDVEATFAFTPGATTAVNALTGEITTTSATLRTVGSGGSVQQVYNGAIPNNGLVLPTSPWRVQGPATAYMVAYATFTGTMSCYGALTARRRG